MANAVAVVQGLEGEEQLTIMSILTGFDAELEEEKAAYPEMTRRGSNAADTLERQRVAERRVKRQRGGDDPHCSFART